MQDPIFSDAAIPDAVDPFETVAALRDHDAALTVQRAVESRQVLLAFQPVVRAATPEPPAFHEALVRVLNAAGRIVPASEFIEAVEHQEIGRKLDTMALDLALRALVEHPELRLSVNMSAHSIGDPKWRDILHVGLSATPTVGERLILEITERTANLLPELVQVFMAEMQPLGITFALDHFGAGYTAFRHLCDFRFDLLKIDGGFTRGIARSPGNQLTIQAILAVARQFGMQTVAEHVEAAADADVLTEAGCDFLQGYAFGAPTVRPAWQSDETEGRG